MNTPILLGQNDVTQGANRGNEGRFQSQSYLGRRKIAVNAIKELQKGTLIVRLVSFHEKIEHLQKIGKTEKAEIERLTIKENHLAFYNKFKEQYDFSDVVFCYGNDLDKYLDGKDNTIFLNKDLEVDESIKIKEGPVYILASQAKDSYYLFDKNFNRIPEPAPHAIQFESVPPKKISLDRFMELFKAPESLYDSVLYFNSKLVALSEINLDRKR